METPRYDISDDIEERKTPVQAASGSPLVINPNDWGHLDGSMRSSIRHASQYSRHFENFA